MATTQYIGARYVPLFAEPLDWSIDSVYEALTIVYYAGNSYTSRQAVPKGIDITNEKFWALTGNYNAQIEAYRKEVAAMGGRVTENAQKIADEVSRAVAQEAAIKSLVEAEAARAETAEADIIAKLNENKGLTPTTMQQLVRAQQVPDSYTSWASQYDLLNMDTTAFYNLWDGLRTSNTAYMTVETIGVDAWNNPIKAWHWNARCRSQFNLNDDGEALWDNVRKNNQCYPGFLLTSGIHGDEKQSVISLYLVFKNWLEGNDNGEYMLDNFDFHIVPCCNPTGLNNNTRNNYANVNLNRNFPYGWDEATDTDKGASAADQKETQTLMAFVKKYASADYRYSQLIVSMHAHHYALHNDKRTLWFVCNEHKLRYDVAKISTYLHNQIVDLYPELETDASKGEQFCRFVQFVSSPTFDNWARVQGFTDMVCEVPQRFVDGVEYSDKSFYLAYLIQSNVLYSVSNNCTTFGRDTRKLGLFEIGCSTDSTLEEIVAAVPEGAQFQCVVNSDTPLNALMPAYGDPVAGMLLINKNITSDSLTATLEWTTTSAATTRSWKSSSSSTGEIHRWISNDTRLWNLTDICKYAGTTSNDITLSTIATNIQKTCEIIINVSSDYCPALYNEINRGSGILKVWRGDDTSRVVHFEYMKNSTIKDSLPWRNIYTSGEFQGWFPVGVMSGQNFSDYSTLTLTDIINNMGVAGIGSFYVASTDKLHEEVPSGAANGMLTVMKTRTGGGTNCATLIWMPTSGDSNAVHGRKYGTNAVVWSA